MKSCFCFIGRKDKIVFLLARLFGKKIVTEDSGYKLTSYLYRKHIYVIRFQGPK